MTGIERAVEMAGGQGPLGASLSPPVSQQAISKWLTRGWLPADRAVEVERIYNIDARTLLSPALVKVLS